MAYLPAMLSGLIALVVVTASGSLAQTPQYTIYETSIQSDRDYPNPFTDVDVKVKFTSPSGKVSTVYGFWDGERTWRVRISPDELGLWKWKTEATDPSNKGLNGKTGQFKCVAYKGDNPLYQRGPLKVSENGRYFVDSKGNPFFWLGDTAWSGLLYTTADDWEYYLTERSKAGINLIQVAATDWRGTSPDPAKAAYTYDNGIRINLNHFQEADKRFAAISRHGYVSASVLLWGGGKNHPIDHIPEADAFRLARYIYSRWSAHNVIWLLAGDGDYRGKNSERWKRLANYLFVDGKRNLVTMHPGGLHWVLNDFTGEPWYDFVGYQSGHGDAETHLNWLLQEQPATDWKKDPPRPFVNLEPNYEAGTTYHKRVKLTPQNVRRAFYWSMMISPIAGITYGHSGIWQWRQPSEADAQNLSWKDALNTEGAACLRYAKAFLGVMPWWKLVPAQELMAEQPGSEEREKYVTAAKSDDGTLAIVYTPVGGELKLNTGLLARGVVAKWFNPRNGKWQLAGQITGDQTTFNTPDSEDWVLCIRK